MVLWFYCSQNFKLFGFPIFDFRHTWRGYSRNASCALHLISRFLLYTVVSWLNRQWDVRWHLNSYFFILNHNFSCYISFSWCAKFRGFMILRITTKISIQRKQMKYNNGNLYLKGFQYRVFLYINCASVLIVCMYCLL